VDRPKKQVDHKDFTPHLILIQTGKTCNTLSIDFIDPEFVALLGLSRQIAGQPVKDVLGTLGTLMESIAGEILTGERLSGKHPVKFTDQKDERRTMWIQAIRLDQYEPDSRTNTKEKITAVAFQFIDMSETYSPSYFEAIFHGMIGASSSMKALFGRIEDYSSVDAPVVITGETGTGKELIARAIHNLSNREQMPFVAVNCTAMNEELFESELFGHEKGAFTSAARTHKGRFERADGGTLFLDEIGDMPTRSQAKLLRVLEENTFEKVGGEREIAVDVRILAATNLPLEQAVAGKRFRSDLYHRLAVLRIHVPPLRDRDDDIPLLVQYFLDTLNQRYAKQIIRLSPDAMRLLEEYHWPGNVRELRNVLERVYVETHGSVIGRNAFREWVRERDYLAASQWNLQLYETQQLARQPIVPPVSDPRFSDRTEPGYASGSVPDDLPPFTRKIPRALPSGTLQRQEWIDGEFQVTGTAVSPPKTITPELLKAAFLDTNGNISRASRLLGIHKATFYRYMKKFSLSREDLSSSADHESH
jgi:transcriptional regulator with GAF, ATPase, and Fis domain